MKKNERNNAKWQAAQWTCAHCPEHLDKLQKREVVEQHLLERYVISPPNAHHHILTYSLATQLLPRLCLPTYFTLSDANLVSMVVMSMWFCRNRNLYYLTSHSIEMILLLFDYFGLLR